MDHSPSVYWKVFNMNCEQGILQPQCL